MQKLQANRYLRILAVGFGSGGSDLFSLRSNLGHCLQIGRPRVKGARSGGALPPATNPAAGDRRRKRIRGYGARFGLWFGRGGSPGNA